MRTNNFMFEEKTAYTFDEVAEYLFDSLTMSPHPSFPLKNDDVLYCLYPLGYVGYDGLNHKFINNNCDLSYITTENNELVCSATINTLLNKMLQRYEHHYAVICETTETSEMTAKVKAFFKKIFNVIDYTFVKYNLLLTSYESQKSHLLDKLQRTRSGNRSMSQSGQNAENSVHIYNDTPQTTDVVATMEGDQFASELNKNSVAGSTASSGSDDFQEAETWDNATIMARLSEIEKQFSNVWMNWLNEFDELFIEEVNY